MKILKLIASMLLMVFAVSLPSYAATAVQADCSNLNKHAGVIVAPGKSEKSPPLTSFDNDIFRSRDTQAVFDTSFLAADDNRRNLLLENAARSQTEFCQPIETIPLTRHVTLLFPAKTKPHVKPKIGLYDRRFAQ